MKKIMFVIGGLAGGGAERVVATIASALAEKDYQVAILTYYKAENEYPFSPKINRINISNGSYDDFSKMFSIKKMIKIRKTILKEKPDNIICFLPNPSVYTFISTLFTKFNKRVIFTVRANPNMETSKLSRIHKFLFNFVRRVITQNEGQKKCFSKKVQKRTIVIPNPMYDELFINDKLYSKEVQKIVSVGRLTSQKNYELAINAIEKIHNNYSSIKYYIYGEGPLKDKLQNMIQEKSLDNVIYLMGFEKDRNKIYGDKDIYLMTSKFEGMPNSLAEAMCMGIPSISTDCDFGPRDLIMNDDMGILLKDYEVDTLVNSLKSIFDNYSIYIEKAEIAKKVLTDNYSFDKIVSKWENIIRGIDYD